MEVAKSVGFKLDSKEKYNKFIYGRDYTPTPTPTPSQVVNPTPQNVTNVLNITRERQGQNEIKIKFKIESNVGNWKITDIKFELPSNSPVGIKDGTVMNGSNVVNWFVSPFEMANSYNTPGTYNFTYQVTVIPTTSNGEPDTTNTRRTRYERISSVVTITQTPQNPLGTSEGTYTNRAGNEFDLYWKKSGFNTTVYAYKKGTTQLQYTNPPSSTASLSVLLNETKLYLQDNVFN
jgi:hypothetical protein